MSGELGDRIIDQIDDVFWEITEDRCYPVMRNVWNRRYELPIIWDDKLENRTGVNPLEIPLKGGGNISLGITDSDDPTIDLNVKYTSTRGDYYEDAGTIITSNLARKEYGFWIFFDNPDVPTQAGCVKFLARFDPTRDINWEAMDSDSIQMEFAHAMRRGKQSGKV
jgi:hypothetical protein